MLYATTSRVGSSQVSDSSLLQCVLRVGLLKYLFAPLFDRWIGSVKKYITFILLSFDLYVLALVSSPHCSFVFTSGFSFHSSYYS